MARQGVQLIAYPQQYGNTVESQIIWGGGVPNGNFTDAVPVSEYDYDNNGNVAKWREPGYEPSAQMQGYYSKSNSIFGQGIAPVVDNGGIILELDGINGPGWPGNAGETGMAQECGIYVQVSGMMPMQGYTLSYDVETLVEPAVYAGNCINANYEGGGLSTFVGYNMINLGNGSQMSPYYVGESNGSNTPTNVTTCYTNTGDYLFHPWGGTDHCPPTVASGGNQFTDYFCSSHLGTGLVAVRFSHDTSTGVNQHHKIKITNLELTIGQSQNTYGAEPTGQKELDLYKDADIPLVLNIDDFKKVNTKYGSYSKNFLLPMTKKNNKFFKHIYEVTNDNDFNVYRKTKVLIKDQSLDIFSGFMQLMSIKGNKGKMSYEVVVFADNVSLQTVIANKTMGMLNLNELNHEYDEVNIRNSWGAGVTTYGALSSSSLAIQPPFGGTSGSNVGVDVLRYPMVDWKGDVDISGSVPMYSSLEAAFRPWVNCLYLLRHIIKDADFQYTSNFLDGPKFNKLYMDMNWGGGVNISGTNFNFAFNAYHKYSSGKHWMTQTWSNLKMQSITPSGSPQGWYDTSAKEFNCSVAGQVVYVVWSIGMYNTGAGPHSSLYRIQTYDGANWTTISNGSYYNSSGEVKTWTGTFTYTSITAGDKIRFQGKQNSPYMNVIRLTSANSNGVSGDRTNATFDTSSSTSVNIAGLLTSLRGDMTQWDFVKGFLTMFNLMVIPDPDDHTHITIEPYVDYIDSGVVHDWTPKLDQTKSKLKPIPSLSKRILFTHAMDDSDWYLKHYQRNAGEVYGQATVSNTYEIGVGEDTEIIAEPFAPTVIDQVDQGNFPTMIVPRIFDADDNGEEPEECENLPRILYDNGEVSSGTFSTNPAVSGSCFTNETSYGLFTPFSVFPTTGVGDTYNFGHYFSYFGAYVTPATNLYNEYWDAYIQELYDKDTRVYEGQFLLTPKDIHTFRFKDIVRIKNKLFRVNKIEYKSGELCKCELITINDRINE